MNKNTESLDMLIRGRAEEELSREVGKVFDNLRRYFGGNGDRNNMKVAAYGVVTKIPGPKDADREEFRIYIPDMLKFLAEKAIENEATARGDQAVKAFMDRVESLGDEIDQLRDQVAQS